MKELDKSEAERGALAGSYLLFRLGDETYGIVIGKIRELVELTGVTRIPGTPEFVCGVLNLRSKVVPVIDLRAKFGMGKTQPGEFPVVIVLDHDGADGPVVVSALVEDVLEVTSIDVGSIENRPDYGSSVFGNDYVVGIARLNESFVFLLDIDRVLAVEESRAVAALATRPLG